MGAENFIHWDLPRNGAPKAARGPHMARGAPLCPVPTLQQPLRDVRGRERPPKFTFLKKKKIPNQ